jgi:hypothetical protein
MTAEVRVFQLVSAVAEFDWSSGHVSIMHGDNLTSEIFDACGWRGTLDRPDVNRVRETIAEHLNDCFRFEWPLLPSPGLPKPTKLPRLTAHDILPGNCSSDNRVMRFGVVTDSFSVTGA